MFYFVTPVLPMIKRILFFVALLFLSFVALHFFWPDSAQNLVYEIQHLFDNVGVHNKSVVDNSDEVEVLTSVNDIVDVKNKKTNVTTTVKDNTINTAGVAHKQTSTTNADNSTVDNTKKDGTKVVITNLKDGVNQDEIKKKVAAYVKELLIQEATTDSEGKGGTSTSSNDMNNTENTGNVVVSKKSSSPTTSVATTSTVHDKDVLVWFMANVREE